MWYECPQKEAIFSVMRKMDEEMFQEWTWARSYDAPPGTLAVGAGGYDNQLKGDARELFLRELRKGLDPETAGNNARAALRGYVAAHNALRPKDSNWGRDLDSGGCHVDNLVRRMLKAAEVVDEHAV